MNANERVMVPVSRADAVELLHILRHYSDALKGTPAPQGEYERCVRVIAAILDALGEPGVTPWNDVAMNRLSVRNY
jgi:hypothetical protein